MSRPRTIVSNPCLCWNAIRARNAYALKDTRIRPRPLPHRYWEDRDSPVRGRARHAPGPRRYRRADRGHVPLARFAAWRSTRQYSDTRVQTLRDERDTRQ